ncbi:MAG: hypothetical protein CH6_3555 [Candidatus Kapaibacterium sp.]|nr:MAG: hypothetical protein CH6_3555 [Candidatus Kapabacteria bacterium]
MIAIVAPLLISVFNYVSGVLVYLFIIDKPNKFFYRAFLTSVLLRYVINLFFLFVCLKYFKFEQLTFGLTYLICTFTAILLEILYINKKSNLLFLQFKQKSKFKNIRNGE